MIGNQINVKAQVELNTNPSFPTASYYVLGYELLERYSFFGTRGLLNQYMKQGFKMATHEAKAQVHLFAGLVYLFPIVGAALSDSYWGKYWTVVNLTSVFLVGSGLLTLFSINGLVGQFGYLPYWSFMIPIILIAAGVGGANPCLLSHGGDQFLPNQKSALDNFFGLIGVSIHLGIVISLYSLPYLKDNLQCFGVNCYPLAFGIPTLMILLALLVFVMGRRHYYVKKVPGEFLPWKAMRAILLGIKLNCQSSVTKSNKHWLDLSVPEYGTEFINETKRLLHVLVMLFPVSFAWMLNDQYGTEWQNQFELTDGKIMGLTISPETSTSLKSTFVIFLIPFLNFYVNPTLKARGYKLPAINYILIGSFLFILAFIVSTTLEFYLTSYPIQPQTDSSTGTPLLCPNCLSANYQLPQWLLLSLGEAFLAPSLNYFAYHQVGPTFKACSVAIMLLTYSIANFTVLILEYPLQSLPNSIYRQLIYILIATLGFIIYLGLTKFYFVEIEDDPVSKSYTNTANSTSPLPKLESTTDYINGARRRRSSLLNV